MPNPLRKSGSSSSGSKNSSSSEKGSGSLDSINEEDGKKGSACSNGGQGKKLSAAKYRAILLKCQGKDPKSDKKKKVIVRLKGGKDPPQGVRGEIGGQCSGSKVKGVGGGLSQCSSNAERSAKVGAIRQSLETAIIHLEEGEIRDENIVPLEPEKDGGKLKGKLCVGGGIDKECCKDVQWRDAKLMAGRGNDDNVCVRCKFSGKLLCCDGKGCKKNYHLKCLDPPLKVVPPGDWYGPCCAKKNRESGVNSLPRAVESNLDAVEVELADSQGTDTTKNNLYNFNSDDSVGKLKGKLVGVVASEHKSESKFVESWVPVKLSDVQLEQYCNILLSNSGLLRSSSKIDTVETLQDVLISTRKCCDHPYFVEPSLQKILTKGLAEAEYLNVGIKASGKLQVLDKILLETKKQGLRVVIIFQSNVGSSGISSGDILDDVVCQRSGVGSYERVDCGLIVPKKQFSKNKQAAMNRFNDKDKGRIVFLLDRRACHPSIKLSSVDIVILYDSDLNPYNDLKVLQKITIGSQHEQLKLFRLYSVCTLEEMVLVNAKQDVTVDAQNLSRSAIHQMLRWGASYLFKQLAQFHSSASSSGSIFSSEQLVKELLGRLPQEGGSPGTKSSSIVVKVSQTGGTYSSDVSLPGELEMQSVDEDHPHVFWEKLLNRTTPKWRYLPDASLSQRLRKRVQYFEGSLEKTDFDYANVPKKRRTTVLPGTIDAGAQKPVVEDKREVGGVNKEGKMIVDINASAADYVECSEIIEIYLFAGAFRTSGGDCSQFLPSPAVPTGAARFRKANAVSSIPAAFIRESDKVPVQQELEGEIREIHQSCQKTVLPPPSESPCPEPFVENQLELVSNLTSGSASQPDNGIQSEPPHPEPLVEDQVELLNNSALRFAMQHDIQLEDGIRPEPSHPVPPAEEQVELVNKSALRSASQHDIQLDNGIQSESPRPVPPVEEEVELVNNSVLGSALQHDLQLDDGIRPEPPRPLPAAEEQVDLVNNSASQPDIQLDDGIQPEPPRPEPPVEEPVELVINSASGSASQPNIQVESVDNGIRSEPPRPVPAAAEQVEVVNNSASGSASQPDLQLDDGIQPEPPRPEPPVEGPVELVFNSASGSASQSGIQVDNGIQSEPPRPEPQVVEQVQLVSNSASGSAAQPILLDDGIQFELTSHDVVEHLEAILGLPMSIDTSLGGRGTCVSDSRSMGSVPDCSNRPQQSAPMNSYWTSQFVLHHEPVLNESARIRNEQDQVGVLINNSAPQPGILQLGRNTSHHAAFPTQPATTEDHLELPTYNDALQDTMLQQSTIIDRCVGGSGTRVTDFRSLGLVPDRVSHHPLHITPLNYARTSQTLPQGDPLLNELARIRQEREKAVKFHEEVKKRIQFDCHKEVQEIYKKYSKLDYDNDTALAQTKNAMDMNYSKVAMNVMLAKYLRDKWQ
ncbi:hypothetical protein MKW98_016650 [Papaver atlanticum]|uniref:PHD-type domain-containing protein n=1 Tax=Papaver atlanticum TaxID=357466 RepID=A0AAD4SS08_9MAGN|nr:hypothetical protein MKW98_016650 [Papaver atlanticum]